MLVTRISPISAEPHTLEVPATLEQLSAYAAGGVLLQDAFPGCSPAEREFIKTGLTPSEWAAMFGVESTLAAAAVGLRGLP